MLTLSKKIVFLMLLFISASITAQVKLEWARTYSNGSADSNMWAQDMAIDRNGYVYVTGSSIDTGKNSRIVTIKYSPSGNIEWVQRYKDSSWSLCSPWSIHLDDSNNVYISGKEIGLLTLKYNTFGVLQWTSEYRYGNWYNNAWDITTDDSGYVYTTGLSTDKFITMKHNRDGKLQWVVLDSSAGGSAPSFITVDSLGNVYVTGRGFDKFYTCYTFKFNRAGVKQWEQVYSGNAIDGGAEPKGIAIDTNGDIVIGAVSYSIGGGSYFATIKYSPSGNLHWATIYFDTVRSYNYPMAFAIDKAGNSFMTGGINQGNNLTDAFGTIKINSTGFIKWNKEYSISSGRIDIAYAIVVDKKGFIYVTGESGNDTTGKDIVIVKYDQNGTQLWVERYPNSWNEVGYKIAVNENGDVYVFGEQYTLNWEPEYITLKYSQWATGIREKPNQVLWSVYPNPTMNKAILEFDNLDDKEVNLTLYNTFGQIVRTITVIKKTKIEIEREDLSSGFYFFQLETNSQIIAKGKLIFK